MLTAEQIANWDTAPASYEVTGQGLEVRQDGKIVLAVPMAEVPGLMVQLAEALRYHGRTGPLPGY